MNEMLQSVCSGKNDDDSSPLLNTVKNLGQMKEEEDEAAAAASHFLHTYHRVPR